MAIKLGISIRHSETFDTCVTLNQCNVSWTLLRSAIKSIWFFVRLCRRVRAPLPFLPLRSCTTLQWLSTGIILAQHFRGAFPSASVVCCATLRINRRHCRSPSREGFQVFSRDLAVSFLSPLLLCCNMRANWSSRNNPWGCEFTVLYPRPRSHGNISSLTQGSKQN